jgi:hypothetical protein
LNLKYTNIIRQYLNAQPFAYKKFYSAFFKSGCERQPLYFDRRNKG